RGELRDELLQLRRVNLFPAVGQHARAEFHDDAGGGFDGFTMHAVRLGKIPRAKKAKVWSAYFPNSFKMSEAELFWSTSEPKKSPPRNASSRASPPRSSGVFTFFITQFSMPISWERLLCGSFRSMNCALPMETFSTSMP